MPPEVEKRISIAGYETKCQLSTPKSIFEDLCLLLGFDYCTMYDIIMQPNKLKKTVTFYIGDEWTVVRKGVKDDLL
jgi:hypothetical protein